MCRALIIGAGGVGTVVTQKVAANPIFSDVMLASRTKSKCDAVAAAIGGGRVKTAQVDADSVPDDIVADRLDSAAYSLALSIDKKSIAALEGATGATF